MTSELFAELGLSKPLLHALKSANYTTPTPIQKQAIPHLLEGRDMLGIAQTGTGKTAAFTLPLLQKLSGSDINPNDRKIKAVILSPTRELVVQISDNIKTYGQNLKLRQTLIMGGVGIRGQINTLRRGVDIIVATPGRLLDLVNQGHADLSQVEYLVLDEADRMLDMGFIKDVSKIIGKMPAQRQSLLFSATMPKEISKLASNILTEPERVEIKSTSVAVERIQQEVHHVNKSDKMARLVELLENPAFKRVIVFTRTKHGADKVVKGLDREGMNSKAIHGNKSQGQRQAALQQFRNGNIKILVATDIASRGIDVDKVTHVINYDLPEEPESYVHRIGRTARAGEDGAAVSLCDRSEMGQLRSIERLIKFEITPIGDVPEFKKEHKKSSQKRRSWRKGPRPAGKRRRHKRPHKSAA